MNHSTHTFTLIGCNCGATMDYRPDPFDMEVHCSMHVIYFNFFKVTYAAVTFVVGGMCTECKG